MLPPDPGQPPPVPQNIDAEQALLGAILINNEAFERTAHLIAPADFYEPVHRTIYEAMAKFAKVGKVADAVTLKNHLPSDLMEGVTMGQYLGRLMSGATTVLNAPDYAKSVREAAVKRSLCEISGMMASEAINPASEYTAQEQIEECERMLHELAKTGQQHKGFVAFSDALKSAIELAAAAFQRDGKLSGYATGLVDLDRIMGGLQRSDLIVLAGRPAMGKTALATNIAFHIASRFRPGTDANAFDGGRVGFFSLEMSSDQLATRILAEQAGISSSDIRRGHIHDSQFAAIVDASNRINSAPLFIDDTGGISVHQLVASARRMKRTRGLDVVVVDYLQLLRGSRRQTDNRVNELTEITTTLKAMAKELEVPVIALSQLSRQVEAREDKRPQLADLRESGSIEQDADVVMFVYRDEYYLKMKEPAEGTPQHLEWQGKMEMAHGKAEIIIGKQRHGPTGTVQVSFRSDLTKFGNLARAEYLPERAA
jgi:replicative DNA helicase